MRKFLLFWILAVWCVGPAWADETLTWDDCLREAAKNHPDLIAAQESVEQSKDTKAVTQSGLLPKTEGSAAFTTSQSETGGNSRSSSLGLSGSQLLFDGLKTINSTHAAAENIKSAQENFRFTSTQVRLRLRSAFVDLLKAQTLAALTQDIYKLRRDNLQLIDLRYESGVEHKGALLTAQANLASAEFDIHQAKRNLTVAQQELTKEMGRREFSPVAVTGDFTVGDDTSIEPDFNALADRHPAVLKALAQTNAAGYDVKSSRGNFFPTVSAEGSLGRSGTGWPPREEGSDAGLRFSVPFFQGGLNAAQLAKSKSIYRGLQASERSIRDDTLLKLKEAWSNFQDAVEKIGVQEKVLTATEERSKIAEAQYSVGLIAFDNWTIIEDDLVRQKKSLLDAQAALLKAQADWFQAKGETLEYEK
jgi:outer membrane protein TolC